jgi:NAD(P)-dependent dehydrogenase (short-subunit alcohol dehydrogenase family)
MGGFEAGDPRRFDGQVAIVAGGASGIGRASALRLAELGARVVIADYAKEQLEVTLQELVAAGFDASSHVTDVSDPDSVQALVDHARTLGEVSVLVNSAGITGPLDRPVHELDLSEFRHTVEVNLWGTVYLTKAVLPGMLAAGYGRMMHVASIAGKEGNPHMSPYNISKAGLIGFVKGAAKEYATSGVTINAIAPAVIRSPMVEDQPEDTLNYMLGRIPMRRMGEPEEVAEVIAFAVSRACSFTTGVVFDASGGRATY